MNIGILAQSSPYFAAPFLAKALGIDLYVVDDKHGDLYNIGVPGIRWIPGRPILCDNLIIIGENALHLYGDCLCFHRSVAVIFSDSNCAANSKRWNQTVKENKITVYAMPDLLSYCQCETVPVYQGMTIPFELMKKDERVLISHSPNFKSKYKGSEQIFGLVSSIQGMFDFQFKYIEALSWRGCLAIKLSSHIFIDQLIYGNSAIDQSRWGGEIFYSGGLGKSGIEAMLCGCCVVTGAPKPKTEPYFPPAPFTWYSFTEIRAILKNLIQSVDFRFMYSESQKQWARQYCNPEFVAAHVTRHIK